MKSMYIKQTNMTVERTKRRKDRGLTKKYPICRNK
jgi:hypothetical protein